jgi:hypothetical protein
MSVRISDKVVQTEQKPPRFLWVKIALLAAVMVTMYSETHDNLYLLLLSIMAVPYALLWIIPPITFHRRFRLQADPSSEVFDPDGPRIPDAVTSTIRAHVPALEALGFTTVGHFHRDSISVFPDAEGFITLLIHRRSRHAARVGTMFLRNAKSARTVTIVGFTTEFTDGTLFATSNTEGEVPSTGLRDGSMAFPEIPEPHRLFKIHDTAVNRLCDDAFRNDLSNVNPERYQRDSILRATTRLVEVGFYYLDEEQQVYRPTWRGAIYSASRQRWPIKPIRTMLSQRRTSRLLRKLGLEKRDL